MSRDGDRWCLIGPDGQPTQAVVVVPRVALPECWARGWCSEACKRVALDALRQGQLVTPVAGWPTMTGN